MIKKLFQVKNTHLPVKKTVIPAKEIHIPDKMRVGLFKKIHGSNRSVKQPK